MSEQRDGQWFELDFSLHVAKCPATETDRLNDAVDYAPLVHALQKQAENVNFKTIERYAQEIADLLLRDPAVEAVDLELKKLSPPLPAFPGYVSVRLHRRRHESF